MTQRDQNPLVVYIELDSLLDTRLGTLAVLGGDDLAFKALETNWHTRDTDVFEFADMEKFNALYAQRDSTVLSKSMCTGLIRELKHLVGALTEQAIARPFEGSPKIVVNLHPYSESLTSEEKDEIQKAIAAWLLGTSAVVEFTSTSLESLTPDFCKANNFAAMVMYDYGSWMEAHAKAFETTRLGDVTLLGPAIYSKAPTEEELARELKEAAHPFQAIEMLASPLVHLQLIEVRYFSVITNRNDRHSAPDSAAPAQAGVEESGVASRQV